MNDVGSDPKIEIYKAVRAHEVMLNQAVSAFEHAVYTRLAALNGGAAAAFVTLLGTLLKPDGTKTVQPVNKPLAFAAVATWLLGLAVATLTAVYGFRRQRAINKGYRIMREEVEYAVEPDLAGIVRVTEARVENHRAVRGQCQTEADDDSMSFRDTSIISMCLFLAGAILALLTVLLV
jgi:hypothetical protein